MNLIVKGLYFRSLFALVVAVLAVFLSTKESQSQVQLIPQNQLSIASVDSEESSYYAAQKSIDGSAKTMWFTKWEPAAPFPHQVTLRLATSYIVTGLRYLPRQDGKPNGIITAYTVYVSSDGSTWGAPVASGTWPGTNAQKEVTFSGKQGRYVRLVATAAANHRTYTHAAEINLLGTPPQVVPSPTSTTEKNLTWVDISTNEEGFKIERRISPAGTFVRLAVVGANSTSYTDKDILAGVIYCYRVQAFNAAGNSPFSNESCSVDQSASNLSQAPSNPQTDTTSNPRQVLPSSIAEGNSDNNQPTTSQQALHVQIGVFRPRTATWYLDRNSNGKFDNCTIDSCPAMFGVSDDLPVVGDWNGSGTTQLGVFNPASQMWDLDKNGNNIWEACDKDLCQGPFGTMEDLPVSGYWRSSDKAATIGIYRPSTGQWVLDLNGDGRLDSDDAHLGPFGTPMDLPVVGDWTGIGKTRIGTFTPQTGQWRLDLNGNGRFDNCTVDRCIGPFGGAKEYPVAADWTGNGTTQIGTFDPASGLWRLDSNGNGTFNGCAIDRCVGPFGKVGDLPVVGHW